MPSLSFPFEPRCRYYFSLFVLRNPSKNKSILRDSKGKVNRIEIVNFHFHVLTLTWWVARMDGIAIASIHFESARFDR